jgi:hypothetical protein
MSTLTLPGPARLRDQLTAELRMHSGRGAITVTPRDRNGRQCSAWAADFYEVAAYYVGMGTPLDELEATLRARPGVVRTTQVTGYPAKIRDADWPGFVKRRDRELLRPQVLAMLADVEPVREELHYRGVDHRGTSRTGQNDLSRHDLTMMVARWFTAGWKSAEVTNLAGDIVAGIGPHPDTGTRTWWSETEEPR